MEILGDANVAVRLMLGVQYIIGLILALVLVVVLLLYLAAFRHWLKAYLANAPIPIFVIVTMMVRRTPVDTIVRNLIMARQGGVDVSCADMESAYLQGVDLEKVTLAAIKAAREKKELSFPDLVTADLEDRLAEKLNG